MKQQQGFTLVELIVVIVVLGILAATAIPRFISVQTEARAAAVQGFAGGLRSAVALVQARWQVSGGSGTASVTMSDGTSVTVGSTTGFPTGDLAGIGNALGCASATDCQGATASMGATTTLQPSGGSATCQASYVAATGAVTATVTDCN